MKEDKNNIDFFGHQADNNSSNDQQDQLFDHDLADLENEYNQDTMLNNKNAGPGLGRDLEFATSITKDLLQ